MTVPSKRVPARYFVMLRDHLQAQGVDTAKLLQMAGIPVDRFDERESTLTPAEVEAFFTSARRLTGRTDLGFEMGSLIKMTSHDLLGYGMLSCGTIDQMLQLVARHYHLMTETFTFRYQRTAQGAEVLYTPALPMPLEILRLYYELLALAHVNQIQLMLGKDHPPYDIYLSMPEPAHIKRYAALAKVRAHFGETSLPGVRVLMGRDLLDMPCPLANPRIAHEVDERCSALGQRPPSSDTGWGDYVRMMLRESEGSTLTLEELARRIKVSARTIDRHLKKEALNFRDLSQQVRFERARELLSVESNTVVQVALRLGFSDAANFSRAFRREVGVSPSEFQRTQSQKQEQA